MIQIIRFCAGEIAVLLCESGRQLKHPSSHQLPLNRNPLKAVPNRLVLFSTMSGKSSLAAILPGIHRHTIRCIPGSSAPFAAPSSFRRKNQIAFVFAVFVIHQQNTASVSECMDSPTDTAGKTRWGINETGLHKSSPCT